MTQYQIHIDEQSGKGGRVFVLPKGIDESQSIRLSIQIDESGVNVRDMSGYLAFIDRVYGRLTSDGLRSYAQLPKQQIQVAEIKPGSWELVFQELIGNIDKVSATLLLGLVLRYLPEMIKSLTGAYKDYEEARLLRLQREKLLKELEDEKEVEILSSKEREQLADTLTQIYQLEQRHLPAAGRFSERYVKSIKMKLVR